MNKFRLRKASEVGVQPAYIKGMEQHGLCYFTWHNSDAVGAQCACCNNIVWVDSRLNEILNEQKPNEIPDSGDGYREYYTNKLDRFLNSLPSCPLCGKTKYDKFINNVSFPRFPDGITFNDELNNIELINEDPDNIEIWWLN